MFLSLPWACAHAPQELLPGQHCALALAVCRLFRRCEVNSRASRHMGAYGRGGSGNNRSFTPPGKVELQLIMNLLWPCGQEPRLMLPEYCYTSCLSMCQQFWPDVLNTRATMQAWAYGRGKFENICILISPGKLEL